SVSDSNSRQRLARGGRFARGRFGRRTRGVAATLRCESLSPKPQQQVIDAVQLDVKILELRVEILPLRQGALGAEGGVDLRHRAAAVDLADDARRQRRQLGAPRKAVEIGDQR